MTYEYRCRGCGAAFEVQATLAEKQAGLRVICPQCHSPQTVQRFDSIGVLRGGFGSLAGGCGPAAGPGCCGPLRI